MVYEFAMSYPAERRARFCSVVDYINRDLKAACNRAPVPHADTPPRLSGQSLCRGLSAYEVLSLWADVPARPAYSCSPTRLQRIIGGHLALCMFVWLAAKQRSDQHQGGNWG